MSRAQRNEPRVENGADWTGVGGAVPPSSKGFKGNKAIRDNKDSRDSKDGKYNRVSKDSLDSRNSKDSKSQAAYRKDDQTISQLVSNADDQTRIRPRSRYVARIGLLAAIVLAAIAVQERAGAVEVLLLTITCVTALLGWMLPYIAAGRLSVSRVLESGELYEDGGHMPVQLHITTGLPMPLMWLSVTEEIVNDTAKDMQASKESHTENTSTSASACTSISEVTHFRMLYIPGFSRTRRINYVIRNLQRGSMHFKPLRVELGDLFGLTVRSFILPHPDEALVLARPPVNGSQANYLSGAAYHPRYMPVSKIYEDNSTASPIINHHFVVPGQGGSRSAAARMAGSGYELRGYVPGDPIRHVNWRAMARGLGLLTRVSEPEQPLLQLIVLDVTNHVYSRSRRLFDAAVGHASLAVAKSANLGCDVLLLCSNGTSLKVRSGNQGDLWAAEEELAQLKPSSPVGNDGQWEELFSKLAGTCANVLCITAEAEANGKGSTDDVVRLAQEVNGQRGRLSLIILAEREKVETLEHQWTEKLQKLQGKRKNKHILVLSLPEEYKADTRAVEGS